MAGRSRRSQHREHVHSCHSPTPASFLTGQVALSSFLGGARASIDGGVAALRDCVKLEPVITTYGRVVQLQSTGNNGLGTAGRLLVQHYLYLLRIYLSPSKYLPSKISNLVSSLRSRWGARRAVGRDTT